MPSLLPADPSPPSNVRAVQDGPTSILVSWSPSNEATGYKIDYDSIGGDNGSVNISSNSTDTLMYTLMNLQNGYDYTISIIATSDHFYSEPNNITIYIGMWYFNLNSVLCLIFHRNIFNGFC